jgi:hypothetical protein
MQEIVSSPTLRAASLTPDDRQTPEQRRGLVPTRSKSTAATAKEHSNSIDKELADLASPDSQEKHQLDEVA